ncbi:MAG: hypothetical protein H6719_08600 [Sandaracinaceae bacterium]|nr:hypothetical protein [Sandaracinaceae bacterium]
MSKRGWGAVAGLVALIVALIAIWALALREDEPVPEADEAEPEEAYGEWAYLGEPSPDEPPPPPGAPGPAQDDPGRRAAFEARRAEWQERWRRAVEIVPLGERAPTVTPDAIREALTPSRERLRECIGESGGWRSFFEARRAQWMERRAQAPADGEPRPGAPGEGRGRGRGPRSHVSFDLRPDGTVNPESLAFDPPMPEAFAPCFEEHFLSLHVEGAGDGASVELPMGPPGGRGRRPDGDGGVGRGWGGRGGPPGGPGGWRGRGGPPGGPSDGPPPGWRRGPPGGPGENGPRPGGGDAPPE